jgi:hypothetical protein
VRRLKQRRKLTIFAVDLFRLAIVQLFCCIIRRYLRASTLISACWNSALVGIPLGWPIINEKNNSRSLVDLRYSGVFRRG